MDDGGASGSSLWTGADKSMMEAGGSWSVVLVGCAGVPVVDFAWKRPRASRIMSSSSSVSWCWEPLALCSANFDFRSSRPMGSPEEFLRTLNLRVRLYHVSIIRLDYEVGLLGWEGNVVG